MRLVPLTLALVLLIPAFAAGSPPAHDVTGTIQIGDGPLRLKNEVDHYTLYSPLNAIGFNYTGNVHYLYQSRSSGGGSSYVVDIVAPAGARNVPFTLDWIMHGARMVDLTPGTTGDDCNDALQYCLT